jgi:diguanylate cyclase (GGDEF)-like protein
VQADHSAMLDEQNGLRSYLVSGDTELLGTYTDGVAAEARADEQLRSSLDGADLGPQLERYQAAKQRWNEEWVASALQPATRTRFVDGDGDLDVAGLTAFLRQGKVHFDTYRAAESQLLAAVQHAADEQRTRQELALGTVCAVLLLISALKAFGAFHRRARLRRMVVEPLGRLLTTVRGVSEGRLTAPPPVVAVADIVDLRDALADMTRSLERRGAEVATREATALTDTRRLTRVLAFAREVTGNLSLSRVGHALGHTALDLTGAQRARVWSIDVASGRPVLAHDTSAVAIPLQDAAAPAPSPSDLVARVASTGSLVRTDGALGTPDQEFGGHCFAFPLRADTGVIGVLELVGVPDAALDATTTGMLEALTGHATLALQAAELFEQTQALTLVDPLTGLLNRRGLEADLVAEIDRAVHTHRPMTLLMIDIDLFKAINDTFGHAHGDAVLSRTAQVLRSLLRGDDTAYRYGGEEMVVIARNTNADNGFRLAERLRTGVYEHFAGAGPVPGVVTISVGIAAVPADATTVAGIVAAADAALYRAKEAGRNRSVIAGDREPIDLNQPSLFGHGHALAAPGDADQASRP